MEETISSMVRRASPQMLVIRISGPMPDGLVELCKAWGIVDDGRD